MLDPQNFRTAWLLTRDRVYRIDNANEPNESITNITGTLFGFSAWWQQLSDSTSTLDLRTIEVVRVRGRSATLLVGGLGGVFRLRDPDLVRAEDTAAWEEFGIGMPNVLVRDLRYNREDDVLLAATFGRGAWLMRDAQARLLVPRYRTVPPGQQIPALGPAPGPALGPAPVP